MLLVTVPNPDEIPGMSCRGKLIFNQKKHIISTQNSLLEKVTQVQLFIGIESGDTA